MQRISPKIHRSHLGLPLLLGGRELIESLMFGAFLELDV
jgi:hypothetical protein